MGKKQTAKKDEEKILEEEEEEEEEERTLEMHDMGELCSAIGVLVMCRV